MSEVIGEWAENVLFDQNGSAGSSSPFCGLTENEELFQLDCVTHRDAVQPERAILERCCSAIEEAASFSDGVLISRSRSVEESNSSTGQEISFVSQNADSLMRQAIKDSIKCRIQLRRINTGREELKADFTVRKAEVTIEEIKCRERVRMRNRVHAKASRARFRREAEELKEINGKLMGFNKSLQEAVQNLQDTLRHLESIKSHFSTHDTIAVSTQETDPWFVARESLDNDYSSCSSNQVLQTLPCNSDLSSPDSGISFHDVFECEDYLKEDQDSFPSIFADFEEFATQVLQ